MRWTELSKRKLDYIIKGGTDMSLSDDYDKGLNMSHGSISAGTHVVDVYNNKVEVPHTWSIEAARNVGGWVMFIRDEEPYYVQDCDVAWYD